MKSNKPTILFIGCQEADYLQDLLFSGLCKLVGKANITEVPLNWGYRFLQKRYPRNLGFSGINISNLFRHLGFNSLSQFNLVIVASCKPKTADTYLKLRPYLSDKAIICFVDGGDFPDLGGDFTRLKRPDLWNQLNAERPFQKIFKREYLNNANHGAEVIPFPFGINLDKVSAPKSIIKKYDVAFWAVQSDPIRTKALTLLQPNFDCVANGTTLNQTFRTYKRKGQAYLSDLASCKIALNFRGAGWDTMRYWEITALGTFMLSGEPKIKIENNFISGLDAVFCNDKLDNLISLADYYLTHPKEREEIAAAGRQKIIKYHQDIHRAATLLKNCGFDI